MSAAALVASQSRRSARRTGVRRAAKDGAVPLTRNALVAEFLAISELDPEVEALRAPAPVGAFDLSEEIVEHTADFELVRDGSPYLVDIATDSDLMQHPLRAAAVRDLVAVDGRPFTIETAASIRAEPRFTTMRLIQACKRTPVTAGDRVRILHQLDECGVMRLVDCAGAAMNASDGVAAVLALACEGLIAVDIARPILPETQVRRRRLPFADPFDF
jgi:hypothetical protein